MNGLIPSIKKNRVAGHDFYPTLPFITFCAICAIILTILFAEFRSLPIRYAVYLLPAIFLANMFDVSPTRKYDPKACKSLLVMFFAIVVPAALSGIHGLSMFIFMFWSYLALATNFYIKPWALTMLFLLLALAQITFSVQSGFTFAKLMDVSLVKHTLSQDTHTIPFVIGLILGPLLIKKQYALFFLCCFCVVLGEKRIVMIGAFIGLMTYYVAPIIIPKLKNSAKTRTIILFMIAICGAIFSLLLPQLLQYIADLKGLNVNIFSSGRLTGQQFAYENIFQHGIIPTLFGEGLGQADKWAAISWNIPDIQIHNDYLRIMIDLGIVFGMMFIYGLVALISKYKIALYLLPYMFTLWLTDNTLTYAFYGATIAIILMVERYNQTLETSKNLESETTAENKPRKTPIL